MEEVDKGCLVIGWVQVGESFFKYQPTRVVSDKGPLNGCVCVCVCITVTPLTVVIISTALFQSSFSCTLSWVTGNYWIKCEKLTQQRHTSSLVVRLHAARNVWKPARPSTDHMEKNAITATTKVHNSRQGNATICITHYSWVNKHKLNYLHIDTRWNLFNICQKWR